MATYDEPDEKPFLFKAAVIAVVAVFAVIGLIGLILPIIPGIVFLALAALLLSKVSTRFSDFLEEQAMWQKLKRHWNSAQLLSIAERIRLAVLWTAKELVNGLEKLINTINRPAN